MKQWILFLIIAIISFGLSFQLFDKAGLIKEVQSGSQTQPYIVTLADNKANPKVLVVKRGDYVQFNGKDGKQHNLSQGLGNRVINQHDHIAGVESGTFAADEAYKVKFKKVGEYDFHDHYNPNMYVTVVVKE